MQPRPPAFSARCDRAGRDRFAALLDDRLQYKNRRSWGRLWPTAIEPWLETLRATPGLCICVAFSSRFLAEADYRALLKRASEQLATDGQEMTGRDLSIAMWKLAPFFIAAPLLQKGALGWYSDHDTLLHGAVRSILPQMLMHYLDVGGANVSLLIPEYAESTELPSTVECGLSLPDLMCGLLADWLPSPFTTTNVDSSHLDREAFMLLCALAQMGQLSATEGPPLRSHVSVVDRTDQGWIHHSVAFNATPRSRE
jgi:hypothetical protein